MPDRDFGRLRPMREPDLARVLDWRNHPSIRGNMYTQHEITMDEHRAWWSRVKDSPKACFYIYEWQSQPLGYVAFSEIAPATGTATWGFYTAPDAPKGTGSLLSLAAMDEAFGPLGLRKLSGEAIGRNAASIGLHESFGFQREGLFRAHVLIGGTFDDVIRLALFSDDWAALRPAKLRTLTERLSQ
ncbi:UDP-4-amino-4,6-dideoxy-N-acetyl-beta-L-altrosamine N-acetyltransferase [Primorskyibacter sp. S87]|uniref:UDP-4-amino-4, 6-dideoxy-N-acetyl-beta-L-altrosamine N-acetyltransferase n=1 Tax=Primorskyibacter sp. S87 TaxID=3415126 RepID=UPI003C7E1478